MSRLGTWGAVGIVAVAVSVGAAAGLSLAWSTAGGSPDVPAADGFQLPFGNGTPSATYVSSGGVPYDGWYVAAGFLDQDYVRERGAWHPGEDWNGAGGGDTDLGQPVLAAAGGRVWAVERGAAGWGNLVMLRHRLVSGEVVFTVYAHVVDIGVHPGELVNRGEPIARIGKGDRDRYWAHLHFEVRRAAMAYFPASFWPSSHGLGPDWIRANYHEPSVFVAEHPARDVGVSTVARAGVMRRPPAVLLAHGCIPAQTC